MKHQKQVTLIWINEANNLEESIHKQWIYIIQPSRSRPHISSLSLPPPSLSPSPLAIKHVPL